LPSSISSWVYFNTAIGMAGSDRLYARLNPLLDIERFSVVMRLKTFS